MQYRAATYATAGTIIYGAMGVAWISWSDYALTLMTSDVQMLTKLQTYKGWSYVALTSALLFVLVYFPLKRIEDSNRLDLLTHLFRHKQFNRYLSKMLLNMVGSGQRLVLILLDVDNFKQVNQQLGSLSADQFLKTLASTMRDNFRANTLLGRSGADQFLVAASFAGNETHDEIVQVLQSSFQASCERCELDLSCCLGIALTPQDGTTADEIMSAASSALKIAKRNGDSQVSYFNRELSRLEQERQTMLSDLKRAIKEEALSVVYQPQFCLKDHSVVGVEVLVRWLCPKRGFVGPDVFIPLAEEFGLIADVSKLVVKKSNDELVSAGLVNEKIRRVSINISAVEFNSQKLMGMLLNNIRGAQGIYPLLQLEITETAALSDLLKSQRVILELRHQGIKFSIDDFGTGFSSLALLKDLPFDEVKIDRSFVDDMVNHPKAMAIVASVIQMAQNFGMTVIAEGVETPQQLEALVKAGCHEAQGYLLARPMAINDLANFADNTGDPQKSAVKAV